MDSTAPVKKEASFVRHAAYAFILAVVGYAIFWSLDQHMRSRNGPWVVAFERSEQGEPRLVINHPRLGITNVQFVVHDVQMTNAPGVVVFDQPLKEPAVGRLIYADLTYWPGAVVLDFFGHEVQMIPRTLVVNKKERPWKSGDLIDLTGYGALHGVARATNRTSIGR